MEMCYNEALVMPSSYAIMSKEEMRATHAGWCVENKWWGYNIYLTHNERKKITTGQTVAGLIAGLASMGTGAAVVAAISTIIWNYDDGYGVRIRMTGPLKFNAIPTGVYSLTKSQQSSIASKNKVIW